MKNISKKYKLIPIKNGDFQLDMTVVKELPEIKLYLKDHTEYVGIYDAGTTVSSIFTIFNMSSPQFQNNLYEICKTNRVSKDKNVFFVETYKKDFDKRLKDIVIAINEIVTMKLD